MRPLTHDMFNKLLEQKGTFIVDFYAKWCGACQEMMPVVESVTEDNVTVPVYGVDIDEHPELTKAAKIKAVPMFVIYSGGHAKGFAYGVNTKEKLQKKINMVMK